jgi:hypothetical protein
MGYYINPDVQGLIEAASLGDGETIYLAWTLVLPSSVSNKIAYNIYYSTEEDQVFNEGPKFVSIDGSLSTNVPGFTPGQLYHFAVRGVEYNPTTSDLLLLPSLPNGLRAYPTGLLASNIGATDLTIPLVSTTGFPSFGIVKIGVELVFYTSISSNNLLVPSGTSPAPAHLVDQGGGHFYTAAIGNIGTGTINNLTLVNINSPAQTWTIKCIFVQRDGSGNPIAGTAKFEAIGSVSYDVLSPSGDPFIWSAYELPNVSPTVSNGILSFSITETTTFVEGDSFVVKVASAINGLSAGRGYLNTVARMHTTSGFDGLNTWSPVITFYPGVEEQNTIIFPSQSRFEYPDFAFTLTDGYHQITKDLLTSDLSGSDASNLNFPHYDYAGWHRTNPLDLLTGVCIGSYIGGELYCADGYDGVGRMVRGLSLQDSNNNRQELLLAVTGKPMCLVRRLWTGITCSCYIPESEAPDDRCPKCFGTKIVIGWEQYFNSRRSDGRIMVSFSPTEDDLRAYEAGLESEFTADCWTLVVPTVKDRDVLVNFDQNDNEEYRYEILSTTRNRTIDRLTGAQKFRIQRVRKNDPIYQIPVFRNTSSFPQGATTGLTNAFGLGLHMHTIQTNENSPNPTNQLTGVSAGHNHVVLFRNGQWVVQETLGHSHTLIIPSPNTVDFIPNPVNNPTKYPPYND